MNNRRAKMNDNLKVGNGLAIKRNVNKGKNTKIQGQRRSEVYQVVMNYTQNRHEVTIK
jgi:hypothetical protein